MKRLAVLAGMAVVAPGLLGVSSAATRPLAGDWDPSFGSGGIVRLPLGSGAHGGIAVQPNGKIVVAGDGFLLARYLPNGSLDPGFGTGGYVEIPFEFWAMASAVALQPDGKIVVAGVSYQGDEGVDSEFTLARFDPSGSLDTSFGTGGITTTVFPEQPGTVYSEELTALSLLPGGDILAAGWVGDGFFDWSSFALARYTPDGSLDPTFGDRGTVQTEFDYPAELAGIALQPDGKIVASGSAGFGGHGLNIRMLALTRYEPDGSLDGTFGFVETSSKLHYDGGPTVLQHGKILVAGTTGKRGGTFPVLARYEPSGRLDSTFGKHGFAEIGRQLGAPTAMVPQNDGKILIEYSNRGETSAVVRLLPSGRPDPSFGRGGVAALGVDGGSGLVLQADGKVLVGGETLARLLGGNNCVIPVLRGQTLSKATARLEKSYCRRGSIAERFSNKVTRGRVISSLPRHGARFPGGTRVHLVISKGKHAPTIS